MSKFQNIIAEAAYAVAGHGFAEEHGSVQESGWQALADVSATTLRNLGEHDLAAEYEQEVPGVAGALVWIHEDAQGFVSIIDYGTDDNLRSGTDLVSQAWDRMITNDMLNEFGDVED